MLDVVTPFTRDRAGKKLSFSSAIKALNSGERRLPQTARGFRWTIVDGVAISQDDKPTGVLPGTLLSAQRWCAK